MRARARLSLLAGAEGARWRGPRVAVAAVPAVLARGRVGGPCGLVSGQTVRARGEWAACGGRGAETITGGWTETTEERLR
ncbi:hypothetical protein C3486_25515 [Streptomyces sp. Ru73]|nr:hypothetical protein C3486_25515 [Streptomyces sp. Ru73]